MIACFAAGGVAQAACPRGLMAQPFAQFGDSGFYSLVPDGGFEGGGSGWSPNGNSIVSENESFFVGGSSDSYSLTASAKVSAVSPGFCVDEDMPSLRFFARKLNPAKGGHLKVEILYKDTSGTSRGAVAGTLTNGGKMEYASWQPSGLLKLSSVLPMSKLGTATVQVRLTADTGGDWLVDDVYADPRLRH